MIGRVFINNHPKLGVRNAHWEIGPDDTPNVIQVSFELDPARQPSTEGFALTTNGDGTEKRFDGSMELRSSRGDTTYTLNFTGGSLSKWKSRVLHLTAQPARELWQITASKFSIAASGDRVDFESHLSKSVQIPA